MTTNDVIKLLKSKEIDFLKTKSFSSSPGIYAFFYIGKDFPLAGCKVFEHEIIYIGKTESSQEKRDAKTHFTSGKTGSSTVRKSIGSILCEQESLNPIPRNDSDYKEGRFSHFMFDEDSEEIITNWMKSNLALSFYEYPKTKQEIEDLETEIIESLVPILNISKNPKNPFKETLQLLRKNCALKALQNQDVLVPKLTKKLITPISPQSKIIASGISDMIYIDNISEGDVANRNIRIKVDNKHLFPSEQIGHPKSYSLSFYVNGSEFSAKYTTGSKDGKSRSGILKLGDNVYINILRIKAGTQLKITKSPSNIFTIDRC